jgi:hypothetical protein
MPQASSVSGQPVLNIQTKLTVGAVDDPLEHEADAMADRVMRMPETNLVQRKCSHCEEEERLQRKPLASFIQRKANTGGSAATNSVFNQVNSTKGKGSGIDGSVKSFMESRFGADFSNVQIHTGDYAIQMSRELNAQAFTTGTDIYFNSGKYSPDSPEGKQLLAHELTHTIQQGGTKNFLQRCPDATSTATFDASATTVRGMSSFTRQPAETRRVAEEIITMARTRDNCLFYMTNLNTLFTTPENPPANVAVRMRGETRDSIRDQRHNLTTPEGRASVGEEEAISRSPERRWTRLQGDGAFYYIDRNDPANMVVLMRVRMRNKGVGVPDDIVNTKFLEDAIENAASTQGYTVNIEFVETSGPDVFDVDVNPGEWTVSTNWVGATQGLAHELHHLLKLPDRYNYITAHSGNQDMVIPERVTWFREQMDRTDDPLDATSLMGSGSQITDLDACMVAQVDTASCITARQAGAGHATPPMGTLGSMPPIVPLSMPSSSIPRFGGSAQAPAPQLTISPQMAAILGSAVLSGFTMGSPFPSPTHSAQIRTLAQSIKLIHAQYPAMIVTVTGHTDAVGDDAANVQLGITRAEAVKTELLLQGVPASVLFTFSHGANQMLVPSSTGEPRNRRVEITTQVTSSP